MDAQRPSEAADSGPQAESAHDAALFSRITRRIMPLLLVAYTVAYLDRVNVGFAKFGMMSQLHLSNAAYGLGAGLFFIGYFIFEVPSNVMLHRIGAKIWITRIMITWGIVSALTVLATGPKSFYFLRFLLGAAEAGFFPGILYYLSSWYPSRRLGGIVATFFMAAPASGLIGGPLSGTILEWAHLLPALHAWQWLLVLEAVPALLLGAVIYKLLPNDFDSVSWLRSTEKAYLRTQFPPAPVESRGSVSAAIRRPALWLSAAIYFAFVLGLYGTGFWFPTILRDAGVKDMAALGFISAIPYALSIVAMLVVGRRSDRKQERRWHIAIPGLLGALGFLLYTVVGANPYLAIASISLSIISIMVALPLFWTLPIPTMRGIDAAIGIAMINSLGNLAGFFGPYIVGLAKDSTHSIAGGMVVLGASMLLGALLTLSPGMKREAAHDAVRAASQA